MTGDRLDILHRTFLCAQQVWLSLPTPETEAEVIAAYADWVRANPLITDRTEAITRYSGLVCRRRPRRASPCRS